VNGEQVEHKLPEIFGKTPLLIACLSLTWQLFIMGSYLRPELIHFCAFRAAFPWKFFGKKSEQRNGKLMLKKRKLLFRHELAKLENKKLGQEPTDFPFPLRADHNDGSEFLPNGALINLIVLDCQSLKYLHKFDINKPRA